MKVLVIDDEPDICEIIAITFSVRWPGAVVLSAGTGKKGIELARKEAPEVIILDVGLSDMDGFEVCRQVRTFSRAPIIMLTARAAEKDKVAGLKAGADDYITKPFNHLELLARVRAVLRRYESRRVQVAEQPYHRGDLLIDFARHEVRLNGREVKLPPVEYSLLYHLVKNPNRVMAHRTLLAKVWGREYVDNLDQLRMHIDSLRSKLEKDPDHPRLIVTEPGVGYKFVDEER